MNVAFYNFFWERKEDMKKEPEFQKEIKDILHLLFPGCIVMKNDPNDIPGIPDLTVLYQNKWAALEVKRSEEEAKKERQNKAIQEYYVDKMNKMSFARVIFPENKEDVLSDLERSFEA